MALSSDDLKNIKELFNQVFDERLNLESEQTFDDKLKYLPTKDEFYTETARIYKKLEDVENNIEVLSHRVYEDHEPRIKKIEKKVGINTSNIA